MSLTTEPDPPLADEDRPRAAQASDREGISPSLALAALVGTVDLLLAKAVTHVFHTV
ncbi:hypothetical protein [Streptomyces albipurpureus]|uniref:MFS transporter n=1 Tax=Streptomyces albipurpureus TaxID=2897419 RepID=A0ABT0UI12_9ACTN|nr:hypothetical protein [Streptomyces sp. CWNU-1]MCM2388294.1 hypothetical protein [Streptomyces sp. CWNU-1]